MMMEAMQLISAGEAARLLGLPEERVYALARAGLLPSVRFGRSRRFSRHALAQFVESGGQCWAGGWRKAAKPTDEPVT
jgi:excisionase family DNA binding protein